MNPFDPTPPEWTKNAVHALAFNCPQCRLAAVEAKQVWLNRSSPVYGDNRRKKWQEFYHCECGCVWWAWSSDRPANEYADREPINNEIDDFFGYF